MKKQIAIAAAITASLALWAAVWPQTTVDKETPTLTPTPAVIAPQAPLPEPTEPAMPLTTETEEADGTIAEPVLEEAGEHPSSPDPEPTTENQAEPAPQTPTPLEPEIEAIGDNSADMVYVPGFGWIESQGPNQATYAEDMYENGNKIGIMG
ncbi:DUF6550 family protein [Anaerotruncus colihominis]|uniref:Uncharacterized protein n=1 Tax=Anaerotruncus colihominis TaxID=169435 RepID=A0A3E3IE55_9FIRM|nr:DUF6550 family protein [Anaerotruncus colihominis]RGE65333.1 hypothetical protein DXC40_17445 [Anaerotruncus colihominis]